jgi:excinuclease UvrABC ATPase subunit
LSIVSDISTASTIDYSEYQEQLSAVDENQQPLNIGVQAFYNQNQTFQYTTDHFLEYMSSSEFASLSTDEAQRIKMITYYTFNSIPLQENWRILISYRIYAN